MHSKTELHITETNPTARDSCIYQQKASNDTLNKLLYTLN
jgi:hypothetical protein